jgi:hypothetical protein
MKTAFAAPLEAMGRGGAWTILRVPFDVEKEFGTRARVPVKGTINGAAFRAQLFPMGGGRHCLMVNKALQKSAKASAGDTVTVELERDGAPRPVTVPRDLKAALARSARARAFFDGLSPSHKRAYTEWITEAKKEDTRARRVEKAVEMLAAGEKRM